MGLIYTNGDDPTRVYEGTDTRAFELLFGAAVAFVWPTRSLSANISENARNVLDVAGGVSLAGILILIASTASYSSFLYRGASCCSRSRPRSWSRSPSTRRAASGAWLGWEPLRWVGVRSYGIYLWQWPIIVFTSPAGAGVNLLRGAGQVALTLLIASLSWRWIEEPIRRDGFRAFGRRLRAGAARLLLPPQRGIAVAGAALVLLLLPLLGLAGALPVVSSSLASGRNTEALPGDLAPGAAAPRTAATTTSCRSVVYIGDSTSEGSISPNFIPIASQRIDAKLAAVGVTQFTPYIAGARDIVEDVPGAPNATGIAQAVVADGYDGCWILAMGTNDAATIAKGGTNLDASARIAQIMSVIGDQPVLWVDAVSRLAPPTFYSAQNMQLWNQSLDAACPSYPNLRIFDWAGLAQPQWFQEDGTHYTTPGYIAKTDAIVQGLVQAFPAGQPPSDGCVVQWA